MDIPRHDVDQFKSAVGVPEERDNSLPGEDGARVDGPTEIHEFKVRPAESDSNRPPTRITDSPVLHDADTAIGQTAVDLRAVADAAAAARPKRKVKGTSRIGLLAMFLGLAACVLCRQSILPPSMRFSPIPPATAGLVLAFLALVGVIAGSRAKSGTPLLAALLCLAAITISAYQGGARDVNSARQWANGQVRMYKIVLARLKDQVAPSGGPTHGVDAIADHSDPGSPVLPPEQGPQRLGQSATPATGTPEDADADIGAGTIFDMRVGVSPGPTSSRVLPSSSEGAGIPTVSRQANDAAGPGK